MFINNNLYNKVGNLDHVQIFSSIIWSLDINDPTRDEYTKL